MSKSNVAVFPAPARAFEGTQLGPATVVAVDARDVQVELESGAIVSAALALASPYEPSVGDVVLVIGREERSWVIGVLQGTGRTVLSFDGDVELRSNDGTLRLGAGRAVEIDAPEVATHASKVLVVAESVVERVVSLTQRVRDLLSVHVGKRHETVDGATLTQAKSATFVTQDDVKINGKTIHLG